jgi:hypothetical protein
MVNQRTSWPLKRRIHSAASIPTTRTRSITAKITLLLGALGFMIVENSISEMFESQVEAVLSIRRRLLNKNKQALYRGILPASEFGDNTLRVIREIAQPHIV